MAFKCRSEKSFLSFTYLSKLMFSEQKGPIIFETGLTVYTNTNAHRHHCFIMPPTLKKLEGHIASGSFIRLSVCLSRFLIHSITLEMCMLLFWLIWIPHEKIADTYFSLDRVMPLFLSYGPWKNMDEILSARYIKKIIETRALKLDE